MESKSRAPGAQKPTTEVSEIETTKMILATLGDTTWRMLVPSVGFTLLGVWLDAVYKTKPWLMFIGIALGFLFAILLVKKQLSKVKRHRESKG